MSSPDKLSQSIPVLQSLFPELSYDGKREVNDRLKKIKERLDPGVSWKDLVDELRNTQLNLASADLEMSQTDLSLLALETLEQTHGIEHPSPHTR